MKGSNFGLLLSAQSTSWTGHHAGVVADATTVELGEGRGMLIPPPEQGEETMKSQKIDPKPDTAEQPADDQVPSDPDPAPSADQDDDPWSLDPLSPLP
jgi:hypothetical protein